ncbi:MAG: hypothetical protein ABI702_18210 [Burkholderiales bacterium]
MSIESRSEVAVVQHAIDHSASSPPVTIPPGHIGEFVIPGTGRRVWWTGRVAIGLLHQPQRCVEPSTHSSLWIQQLMLATRGRARERLANPA